MPDQSVQARRELGAALRDLREQTDPKRSADTVARIGGSDDAKLTGSQIAQIERGEKWPRHTTLLAILRGIDLPSDRWTEPIRLAVIGGELNTREVGFERAARTLHRLATNDLHAALEDVLQDREAEEIERALTAPAPARDERQRGRERKPAATQATGRASAPTGRARRKAQ